MFDTMHLEYLFCCAFTTNNIILDLLEDLATKKQKCSLSNKLDTYGEDYHKLYKDVLKYFKLKDNTKTTQNKKFVRTWSSIRKKSTKDFIIKNYIIEVKHQHNFDDCTTKNLKRDLMIGLNFKNINSKNIVLEDDKIVQILGLNLSTNSYTWDYDIFKYN